MAGENSSEQPLKRRSFIEAIGAITASTGILCGASASTAARESPSPPSSAIQQYAGELTGTLHYTEGGAEADRNQQDTSFAHSVELTVVDQSRSGESPLRNPIDVVISTTPEVVAPLEGDINIVTGFEDKWGDEIIDYTPYWSVYHDSNTGETRGSKLQTVVSTNLIWIWWFGISGVIAPQAIYPPSSFTGTITERAANLQLALGDLGPRHVLRADLSAERTG